MGNIFVAIGGGLVGFWIAAWRARYAATARDLSDRIEDVCKLVTKVEEEACCYWVNPKEQAMHSVIGYQAKIRINLRYLSERYSAFKNETLSAEVSDFFEACTGDNFGSTDETDYARQRTILQTGELLRVALVRLRTSKY